MKGSSVAKVKPPSTTRVRLTAEERRTQIMAAARDVFAREGFAGARTRDIAAAAGINEALMYRHFASKEDLFEAAVAQPLERAVTALAESVGSLPAEYSSEAGDLRQISAEFVGRLYDVMADVAPLLGLIMFSDTERGKQYFRKRLKPSFRQLAKLLEQNYDSWPHREYDPNELVEWMFGITWFAATIDNLTNRKRDRHAVARQIVDLIVDGLIIDEK
jgi:TetR/AcrR family transcriptional regulator